MMNLLSFTGLMVIMVICNPFQNSFKTFQMIRMQHFYNYEK